MCVPLKKWYFFWRRSVFYIHSNIWFIWIYTLVTSRWGAENSLSNFVLEVPFSKVMCSSGIWKRVRRKYALSFCINLHVIESNNILQVVFFFLPHIFHNWSPCYRWNKACLYTSKECKFNAIWQLKGWKSLSRWKLLTLLWYH